MTPKELWLETCSDVLVTEMVNGVLQVSCNVTPPAPVAEFSATPLSGIAPLTVQFTDASTGSITSWAWDFQNNGSTDSTAQNPSYTYASAGTYSVKLVVTGPGGSSARIREAYITVGTPPQPPVAEFSATPLSGITPLTVQVTDASTGSITSWALG